MSIPDEAKQIMMLSEGLKLEAYKCPAGIWTIGYGNTYYEDHRPVKEGDIINQSYAELLFNIIVEKFETDVKKLVHVPITDNQLGALVSFAYNVGVNNLKNSTLLKKLNQSDYTGASEEFKKWNKAGGKILKGLVIRRNKEKDLFNK